MAANPEVEKTAQEFGPRQWARLIIVYLFIPLILLICAGDFGWWQGWVFALLIVAAGVGGSD